jgi:hypothetical protein
MPKEVLKQILEDEGDILEDNDLLDNDESADEEIEEDIEDDLDESGSDEGDELE